LIVHGLRGGAPGGAEGQEAQRWRVFTRVAGIDVHKRQVTAVVRTPGQDGGRRHQQLRRFSTFYRSLQEMAWLRAEQTTHVAMEATGVYWRLLWS